MSDMAFIKAQVKERDLYHACMAGWVVSGGIAGSFAPAVGTAAGAAGGLVWGLLTCGPMSRMAAKKFLDGQSAMTATEVSTLANEMSRMTGVRDPDDLLKLLLAARTSYRNGGSTGTSGSPQAAAQQILGSGRA